MINGSKLLREWQRVLYACHCPAGWIKTASYQTKEMMCGVAVES